MGDSIVALYDRPMDVVDLTVDETEGHDGAPDGDADGDAGDPNLPVANDSGIVEFL
jgi:hypothetical protein